MAGEIIALGEDVKDWKVGDRVCANFSPDHLYGDTTPAIIDTSLGGQAHGVLTQYRTFPAHVCICLLTLTCFTTDDFSLSWRYLGITVTKKHLRCRMCFFPVSFGVSHLNGNPDVLL